MQLIKNFRMVWACSLIFASNLKLQFFKFAQGAFQAIRLPTDFSSSFQIVTPLVSTTFLTHAMSGATTEVRSTQKNSMEIEVGEDFNYNFYIQGKSPTSIEVSQLPAGLSKTLSTRSGSITGSIEQPGDYLISIYGYNSIWNAYTPTFELSISVTSTKADPLTSLFPNDQLTSLGSSWYSSSWLGEFYSNNQNNWIYHKRLGWVYLYSEEGKDYWVFDENLGWLFVNASIYPFFYSFEKSNWLYLFPETTDKHFWDYSSNSSLEHSL
ncbi:MAG: hypothetical protein CMI27_03255 [Opitutae bacterium]|nr:hypothetical protein [Opitutae bacterium]|tara:strand:- start:1570 stop:2370 length:801 start_codon:yes stop_codon:yes gene_type:complete